MLHSAFLLSIVAGQEANSNLRSLVELGGRLATFKSCEKCKMPLNVIAPWRFIFVFNLLSSVYMIVVPGHNVRLIVSVKLRTSFCSKEKVLKDLISNEYFS